VIHVFQVFDPKSTSICRGNPILFWEENKQRAIEAVQFQGSSVKSTEELVHIVFQDRPKVPIERGTKIVWSRTGVDVHIKERMRDLKKGEGLREGRRGDSQVGVELLEVKIPSYFSRPTKEIQIEIIEDGAFCVVCTCRHAVMLQTWDRVLSTSAGGSNVKEARVLVPVKSKANVEPLAPKG